MVNTSYQSNFRSIAAVICKTAFVLGLLALFMVSPAQAQNYGPEQSICWNNWGNFDRIRVRFEATNRNSDYDTNILVNGQTIASVGRDPWGGNSYSGETYVYKPISINLGWQFVGGPWWGGFNGRIDYGCNPTFEDSGISPVEGTFYFYGSYLIKSNIGITKSATPTSLKAGAPGQFYTINVNITNAATTAPTFIYDNLPAGISTAGAITISRGSILGCPAAGATSLSGCYIPTGASGTFSINVPINIANNTASTVTNTAYAYNTGSANCITTTSCPGSSTNPVAPNSASFFVQQAIYYTVKSPGPWTFSYSGTNGVGSPTLTNTVVDWAGAANSPTYTLGALGANTVLNVPSSPGWYVSWASCSDLNAATTGNPTGNLAAGSGSTWGTYVLTIPAANVRGGSAFQCQVVYSASAVRLITKLAGPRINDSDQFVVKVTDANVNDITSTTSGTGSTVTGGDTGWRTYNWGSHTIQQTMAPGSTSALSSYNSTVSCSNAQIGGTNVSGVTKIGDSFTSGDPDIITCTITNTPKAPLLRLKKALGTGGRISPNDQFVIEIYNEFGQLMATQTTTGTGDQALGQAQATAVAGVRYMVGEKMAAGSTSSVEQYRYPVSCTNALSVANGGTDVSSVTSQGALFGPLRAGDDITCTITNTAKQPRLTVQKRLGTSGRIDPADQFRLEVFRETGGALVGGVTTTGNTTTPNEQVQVVGVIGERYMIGEKMAPGSVSNVEQYSYPLSCTNSFSTANGGSDVSGVTSQGTLFGPLRAGDNISCVITNTAKRASLFLTQSLNDAIHRYPIVVRYAANNGWTTTQLSSSVNTEITSTVQNLNATGVAMQFNLTMPNVFWRISSVACTDANASLTGNPTRSFGTVLSATSFSLNAENVRAGSQLKCALLLAAPPPF